ncbi:late embryogenesis abundant protein [Striga asiatica]|uniref:Late embryogenesis abundant protein n=1 Tax=Striga asiatica TaxID=4170 RepID=A0A5A7QMN7_STRAF|nr:late embryogenesis abundant protein [Striga asiatica]
MQGIKEKLSDMSAMRHAKAEAKEEEKEEKELAKTRVQVAHEVRMAREAEAAMDLHVNKAAEKVAAAEQKHHRDTAHGGEDVNCPNPGAAGYSADPMSGGAGAMDPSSAVGGDGYGGRTGVIDTAAARSSGPTAHNDLL